MEHTFRRNHGYAASAPESKDPDIVTGPASATVLALAALIRIGPLFLHTDESVCMVSNGRIREPRTSEKPTHTHIAGILCGTGHAFHLVFDDALDAPAIDLIRDAIRVAPKAEVVLNEFTHRPGTVTDDLGHLHLAWRPVDAPREYAQAA